MIQIEIFEKNLKVENGKQRQKRQNYILDKNNIFLFAKSYD
jgi:hypothetical protein